MPNCTSCGSSIPDGQGSSCSMCYGDIGYGTDGYYEEWAMAQEQKQAEQEQAEQEQAEHELWFQKQSAQEKRLFLIQESIYKLLDKLTIDTTNTINYIKSLI